MVEVDGADELVASAHLISPDTQASQVASIVEQLLKMMHSVVVA